MQASLNPVEIIDRLQRAERDRDRYRAALEVLLALRSSVERDRGNDVPLVGNLQAREIIEGALRDG